jgi:hypothetical protein
MDASARIFEDALAKNWPPILDTIQTYGDARKSDPVFAGAVITFVSAFVKSLSGPSFPARRDAEVAERILLFHSANRLRLDTSDLQILVHRSLRYWVDDSNRMIGLARLLPDDALCQAILREEESAVKEESGVGISERRPRTIRNRQTQNALLPIFRSKQEEEFYHAAHSFYPQHLIGVNVSIQTIVNLDAIRDQLNSRERAFFFRGILDTVIYDTEPGFMPIIVFEIDSPLHDDQNQIERDGLKDRILLYAGLRLVRIRPESSQTNRRQFLALLRNAEIAG